LLEPLQHARSRIVARKNAARVQEVLEGLNHDRQGPIRALRQRLYDEIVVVSIDDQGRQAIGLAMDEAVRGRVDGQRCAKCDRRLEPTANEAPFIQVARAARIFVFLALGSVSRRTIENGQHPKRDLRRVAVKRSPERPTAWSTNVDHIARCGVNLHDIRSVDPGMAAVQALLATRGDHDGGNRHERHIVQLLPVRIAIGSDHAGFALKEHLKQTLVKLGHSVDDRGTSSEEPVDYPPICLDVARAVARGLADRGIVLGGSGQGEQIAANKVVGIRAALCNDLYTARLSREHNDANVLSMGGRIVANGLADEILTVWLATPFQGGRHQRRLDEISEAETHGR
jgi:ribose 5-phosphate isomerase B